MIRVRARDDSKVLPVSTGNHQMINEGSGRPSGFPQPFMRTALSTATTEVSFDENHGRPPYRVGGPFYLWRLKRASGVQGFVTLRGPQLVDNSSVPGQTVLSGEKWRFTYQGGFLPPAVPPQYKDIRVPAQQPATFDVPDPDVNPEPGMGSLGNSGWSKLRPDPQRAGGFQFFAELRDAPRMGRQILELRDLARGFHRLGVNASRGRAPTGNQGRRLASGVGSQHLGFAFGWGPFLRDLRDGFNAYLMMDEYIRTAERLNNEYVKRRFSEKVVQTSSTVYTTNASSTQHTFSEPSLFNHNPFLNLKGPGLDELRIDFQKYDEVWYEGKFKFYSPAFDKRNDTGFPALDKARKMLDLYGVRVNATNLYRITPWTWLADWFLGIGDAVQRAEDIMSDSVAADYFYIMRHMYARYQFVETKRTLSGPCVQIWNSEVETKRRVPGASAFSFVRPAGGLSAGQLAILASLGLSKWL
jgi:hypothetical protein